MSTIIAKKICRSVLLAHQSTRKLPILLGNSMVRRQQTTSSSSPTSSFPTKRSKKPEEPQQHQSSPPTTDNKTIPLSSPAKIPPIPVVHAPPDMAADFHTAIAGALHSHYHETYTPVILRGFLQHNEQWAKAMANWKSLEYLASRINEETFVRGEIGHYDSGETVELPFGNYVEYLNFFEEGYGKDVFQVDKPKPVPGQVLYVAQNEIPPLLLEEICIPKVCSDPSFGFGQGQQYQIMFWMGPPHSFSPLHYDPMDNLLFQVMGRKQVILVDPKQSIGYGMYTGKQNNTSTVHDLESVDRQRFPDFPDMNVVGHKGVLNPGDILFLPAKYWHSTKSLDFSISVNSWWR